MIMLMLLGTNQAWSVFVKPLRAQYGYSAFQMQLIFNTVVLSFCPMVVIAGRLHDRFGPRPLAVASAVLIGLAWTLAWLFSGTYVVLWFAIGICAGTGCAVGYVCPIATALKWFPNHQGLISGLTAAGFACGPVLLSTIAESLMHGGAMPSGVFGVVALTYAPVIFLAGMMLWVPPGPRRHEDVISFRRRTLFHDRRFRALFAGMLTGTIPFLIVVGNAKPLALDCGLPEALAAMTISVLAIGNAIGRGFWGITVDRIGPRHSMISAQTLSILAVVALIVWGRSTTGVFFASTFGIGFCYGSNFAIYPATVSRLYGVYLLGSVYPFVMTSQVLSSLAPTLNGLLNDATGSNLPGLFVALIAAVVGSIACLVLMRPTADGRPSFDTPSPKIPVPQPCDLTSVCSQAHRYPAEDVREPAEASRLES